MYNIVISVIVGFASGVVVVLAFLDDFNYDNKGVSQNICASEPENVLVNTALDTAEINRLKEQIAKLESDRGATNKSVQENIDSQSLDCSAAIHSAIQAADKKMNLLMSFKI